MSGSSDAFAAVRRFYTHALGCRPGGEERDGKLAMDCHGQDLVLERADGADGSTVLHEPPEGIVLDIDAWCDVEQRLRENGVPVSISVPRPMGMGPGQQCLMHVSDPCGNVVTLRGFAVSETMLAA